MNPPSTTHVAQTRAALTLASALAAALLFDAAPASAQAPRIAAVELALGASPLHMVAGHGRMSVGITREGDVAVLTWPSPSCCDQLTFLAPNAADARSRPRTGVRDGMGVALGLVLRVGAMTRVVWLHDVTEFEITPGYASETVLQPRIEYRHRTLGVRVLVHDAVSPTSDVFQRAVTVTRESGSTVDAAQLLVHSNLGLTQNVIPRLPMGDVAGDSRNDFAGAWDARESALMFFRPEDRGRLTDPLQFAMPPALTTDFFGPIDAMMRDAGDLTMPVANLLQTVDATFRAGVYAYVATEPAPDQFHVGREGGVVCDEIGRLVDNVVALPAMGIDVGIDVTTANALRCQDAIRPANVATARGWTRTIPSAWDDAQDGALSGNPIAAYLNDGAQRVPLTFDSTGQATARVLFVFDSTAAAARTRLANARARTTAQHIADDADAWTRRAATLALPDTLPATIMPDDRTRIVRAARRAMLHVINGTDAATGAIVASIARQAPYGLDWPRDGAFFSYALDVAGLGEQSTRRFDWILPAARAAPLTPGMIHPFLDPAPPIDPRNGRRQYPEAAWEMNYYADTAHTMGGFFRFEIDNTAWMVWAAAVHVAYIDAGARRALAERYWAPVRRSTEMLAAWRDDTNGLNAPAQEDDNNAFTSTLHGGTSVFAALEAAARLARLLGHTDEAQRWEHRAGELRDALVRVFYSERDGRFLNNVTGSASTNPGSSALGPTSWLVWPSRLLPYDDTRVRAQVRYDLEQVLAQLRGAPGTEGGAYLTKNTLSAALYLANGGDATLRPLLEEAVVRIARDVITPDTQVMGEVFVTIRNPDGSVQRLENRVSLPHLWEATLFYLTVMAMSHPERFGRELRELPANQTPAPGTVPFVPRMDAGVDAGGDGARSDGGLVPTGGGCGCRIERAMANHARRERWSFVGVFLVAAVAAGAARRSRTIQR